MNEEDFDGTIVLEKLAEIGARDPFFDAIDSDDFRRAVQLMKRAGVAQSDIQMVLRKMAAADGDESSALSVP